VQRRTTRKPTAPRAASPTIGGSPTLNRQVFASNSVCSPKSSVFVSAAAPSQPGCNGAGEDGFSLLELMISLAILSLVIGVIGTGMMQITNVQGSIKNRTEMHTSVRNATELMQQEIGQAGRIALPTTGVTLTTAVTAAGSATPSVTSSTGMFPNMYLDVDTGANYEFVQATAIGSNAFTANFAFTHLSGAPVTVTGGFATGIVPPANCTVTGASSPSTYCYNQTTASTYPNGSTGTVLKLYGDINRDGKILYVEYTCSPGTPSAPGDLYRNEMSFTATSKPPTGPAKVLVSNLLSNPPTLNPTPCFQYQTTTGNSGDVYVVDVAVTLTVQTQLQDPQTHQCQQETKALLNVSPRNVFEVWELDTSKYPEKIQPMPATVTTLLP
jgi:prepilin-type N-terminal cleavage/methylation domain-containing protein